VSTISTIIQVELPSGGTVDINRFRYGSGEKRVAIVAGIRGDTPEGLRVAHIVSEALLPFSETLCGTIDIYPCVNPLAAEQGLRLWPFFQVDLNRRFPGNASGHPPDRVAAALVDDIKGADVVIELRGARPGFEEIPNAMVRSGDEMAMNIAQNANVQYVWVREPGPAAPKTFAYQFPHSLILEGGAGNRLVHDVGQSLKNGVLNLLSFLGIFPEEQLPFAWATIERPLTIVDNEILRVRARCSGLFIPNCGLNQTIEKGMPIGRIIDPKLGLVREEVVAEHHTRLVAIRHHPVVSPGTVVARLIVEKE
jgi:hypothetical protein